MKRFTQTSTCRTLATKTPRITAKASLVVMASLVALTGCTAVTQPINGVPSNRLPPQFFETPKNELLPIDISLLQREKPRQYILGPGDVLGITVDSILPAYEVGEVPEPPPVNFPEQKSTLPPSTGFPITVLEDGTITLPLLEPLVVEGLSVDQTRDLIRKSYIESQILSENQQRKVSPIVTMIKKRQINVVVIRQDQGSYSDIALTQQNRTGRGVIAGDYKAEGQVVRLDAFENDILHALTETGGLPGLNAKNEVKILRSTAADKEARREFMRQYQQVLANHMDPCSCPPPMPDDPTVLKVPLRLAPGVIPSVTQDDVILEDGDILIIENRENEFFYTAGLLPGGQWAIPRDYDLDVLGAMALAGYGIGATTANSSGLSGIAGRTQVIPPGRLYILRRTPCNGQIAIAVDLAASINDPSIRPIIQPGDTLVLQYKATEELINFGLSIFFTYGLAEVLRGR